MDGKYLNKQDVYIEFLNKWIENLKLRLNSKSKNVFDDVHINDIDPIFEDKSNWLTGSLEILKLFKKHLANTDFDIILCIFLNRTKLKNNIPKSITQKEINRITTHPSLYLFRKGNKTMIKPTKHIVDNLSTKYKCNVYFGENQELPPEQRFLYRFLYFVIDN